ncbi:MAG TPA: isochorismatase family protein, partial [Blastocatellia bacterium]|nr:isochorismatase family protein [Blastocatellia bacterium]
MPTKHPALLDRRRAALAVIDMQDAFRKIIGDFDEIAARVALLVQAANLLNVPVIVTEQYPKGLGRTVEEIARQFAENMEPIEKLSF